MILRASFILNRGRKGMALMGLVMATVVAALSLIVYFTAESSNRQALAAANESFLGYASATELLEFFRSFTPEQLKTYLKKNPVDNLSLSGFGAYPICAHINLLDTETGILRNKNSIADMPPSSLDKTGTPANRFFQVQIINVKTFVVNKAYCVNTARQLYLKGAVPEATFPGQLAQDKETIELSADERFLVTVGVSWVETGKPNQRKRVTLSTLIL